MVTNTIFKCRACGLGIETDNEAAKSSQVCPACLSAHMWMWCWYSKKQVRLSGTSIASTPSGGEIEYTTAIGIVDTARPKAPGNWDDIKFVGVGYWKRRGVQVLGMFMGEDVRYGKFK